MQSSPIADVPDRAGPSARSGLAGRAPPAVVAAAQAQDAEGNTALHWAAWHRREELIEALLERGARPEAGNSAGETPLHWAAKASSVAGLGALSRSDRSLLTLRDCDGFTPFIISAQNDNAPVMEWLYMQGVSAAERDDLGRTALQWACYKGHRRSVQWLLSRSADIAHQDQEGMTALHWVALKGHEQVAEKLLEVGAVRLLHLPDVLGETPMTMAWRRRNYQLLFCFCKAAGLHALIGRSSLARNNLADLFVCLVMVHALVLSLIVAPVVYRRHPGAVAGWSALATLAVILWARCCLSDPGWVRPPTIREQSASSSGEAESAQGCGAALPLRPLGGEGCCEDGPRLRELEAEQGRLAYQRRLTEAARAEARAQEERSGPSSQACSEWVMQLDRTAEELQERERALCESVAVARRAAALVVEGVAGEYLELLERSEFRQICVVCRCRRPLRSQHCKECGRCVDRLDHYCPWIDNCVGLGNQRSFYIFILVLLATLGDLYHILVLYAMEILPGVLPCSMECLSDFLTARSVLPALRYGTVLALALLDLIWLVFVGALVARQTAYIAVNLTTFEALVRPGYVQSRFPDSESWLWFLRGLGAASCIGNCARFWTNDASFEVPSAQDVKDGEQSPASPAPLKSWQKEAAGRKCCYASAPMSPDAGGHVPRLLQGGPQQHASPCTPAKRRRD